MASITSLIDSPVRVVTLEQLRPGQERVPHHCAVRLDPVRAGRRLVHHEPAADGVVGALRSSAPARRTPRRSSRSGGTAATGDGAASDPGPGRSRSRARPSMLIRRSARIRSTRGPTVSVSTVSGDSPASPSSTAGPLPCPCPVAPSEPNSSACTRADVAEQPVGLQPADERPRGPHRPHRVRAGRPDTDAEEVENTDHGRASSPSSRRTGPGRVVTAGLTAPLVTARGMGAGHPGCGWPICQPTRPAQRPPGHREAST